MPKLFAPKLLLPLLAATAGIGHPLDATAQTQDLPLAELRKVQLHAGKENHAPRGAMFFAPLSTRLAGQAQIVNGIELEPNDFPVTVQATSHMSCTATLIGPQVLLTAAHCVDSAQRLDSGLPMTVPAKVKFDTMYDLQCAFPKSYAKADPTYTFLPRTAQDWALCFLTKKPPGLRPETVSLTPPVAGSVDYFLIGFGCSAVKKQDGVLVGVGMDGKLLAGTDALLSTAVGLDGGAGGFAVARADGKEPSLCPGDSGGGTMTGITLAKPTLTRRVALVNSALGSSGDGKDLRPYSYFAPLGTGEFESFAREWAGAIVERRICGIHIKGGDVPCRP